MKFLNWLTADHPDSREAEGKAQLVAFVCGIIFLVIALIGG